MERISSKETQRNAFRRYDDGDVAKVLVDMVRRVYNRIDAQGVRRCS